MKPKCKPPKGFSSFAAYFEASAKERGFESYKEYKDHIAKERGFRNDLDYKLQCAKHKGFKSSHEFKKHIREQDKEQQEYLKQQSSKKRCLK